MANLPRDGDVLHVEAFRHFAPLLSASQEYALHSGCRFRGVNFSGVPEKTRLCLEPVVSEYSARLQAGEECLVSELESAFHIVTIESIRSAMLMTLRELDLSPPNPAPPGITDDDCSYDDVSAELPIIAQRLYNDEARRLVDSDGVAAYLQRRALTASYLMDFAHEVGSPLPPVDETLQATLQGFASRVSEWQHQQGLHATSTAKHAFLNGLGIGVVADELRTYAAEWWIENADAVRTGGTLLALSTPLFCALAAGVLVDKVRVRTSERKK